MSLDVTVTDLFCGAGGSSIGAEAAGATLRMAANHWRLAIETHNSNFPDADHDCADVSQVNPRRYPHTDVLIASPECTNHSSAKTHKVRSTIWDPNADVDEERSRATMWDVVRFTEHHRYQLVIVENVVEALRWDPYRAWLDAMGSLGYEHRQLFLNSAIAFPTPQSRDRLYVVFWRKGNRAPLLDFHPRAWCAACHRDVEAIQSWKNPTRAFGKYRSQYVYRCPSCAGIAIPYAWPAASAIDWSLPAPRIGDRKRPLAPATIRRIQAGLERFGPAAIVQAAGHTYEHGRYFRTWPTWQPLNAQTTTIQHGIVIDTAYAHGADRTHVRGTDQQLATQTGQQSQALVVPLRTNGTAREVDQPLPTAVAGNVGMGFLTVLRSGRPRNIPLGDPMATMVSESSGHALVTLRGTDDAAIGSSVRPVEEPVGVISAGGGHHALLVRNFSGGAEMSTPVTEPAGTVTAVDHHSLLTTPFLTDYHGQGSPWQVHPVTEPMGTVETADRRALVQPAIDVDDCGFRMLEPEEIHLAMAFPADYTVKGNKRDRVRQLGNAVTPPVMAMILERAIGSLAA